MFVFSFALAVPPQRRAAIIRWKDRLDPSLLVKRSPNFSSMGGYHAFPGVQLDKEDSSVHGPVVRVRNRSSSVRLASFFEEAKKKSVLAGALAPKLALDRIAHSRRGDDRRHDTFKQILK